MPVRVYLFEKLLSTMVIPETAGLQTEKRTGLEFGVDMTVIHAQDMFDWSYDNPAKTLHLPQKVTCRQPRGGRLLACTMRRCQAVPAT